jgi:hypothetical protein
MADELHKNGMRAPIRNPNESGPTRKTKWIFSHFSYVRCCARRVPAQNRSDTIVQFSHYENAGGKRLGSDHKGLFFDLNRQDLHQQKDEEQEKPQHGERETNSI